MVRMTVDPETFSTTAVLVALSGVRIPDDAPAAGLELDSRDIGNKFGFGDGDVPDCMFAMAEGYFGAYRYVPRDVWHRVLIDLVQSRLLPALGNPPVDIAIMEDSLHNPIRIHTPHSADFLHGEVHVPWLEVLAAVVDLMPDEGGTGH